MKIVFTIILFLSTLSSFAQEKKEKADKPAKTEQKKNEYKVSSTIRKVKDLIKDRKYANANDEINKAMKEHPEALSSIRLYEMQTVCLQNLVLEENRKMYLKQKPDTAKYFNHIYSLYECVLRCDSLEQIPDENGKCKFRLRDSNRQRLMQFRKNLASADRYFSQKQDFKNGYKFADMYLTSKKKPIFTSNKEGYVLEDENDSLHHATLATFLAYADKNYKGVAKHIGMARKDTARLSQLLEVGAKSYYALSDTLTGNKYLSDGVEMYPTNEYFFLTLLKYYNDHSDLDSALKLCNAVVVSTPENRNYWFMKGKQHEQLGQLQDALLAYEQVVKRNADDYEAFSAIGNINLEFAQNEYRNFSLKVTDKNYSKGKERIRNYYIKAKEAYESCSKLAKDNTSLWLFGLRECYYKLNMGKELKTLEKLR